MNAIVKSAGGVIAIGVVAAMVLSQRLQQTAAPTAPPVAVAPMRTLPQAAAPIQPQQVATRASGNAVILKMGSDGHYRADFDINGRRIEMLVDTGASVVALSHEDAEKIGVAPFPSDYTIQMSTANGMIKAARKKISEVRIDTITVRDVDAVVMPPGALRGSLLGMSFLQRLSGFENVGGDRLVLKP